SPSTPRSLSPPLFCSHSPPTSDTYPLSLHDALPIFNDASQTRLPAGPYFRIEGTGINVTVANVVLHGDFALEQTVNQVGQRRLTDRKSTRLNSSHGSISYAVFCLKKKQKQQKHKTTH